MVEWFKAHAWKACEVNSLRRFKSCSLCQTVTRHWSQNKGYDKFVSFLFYSLSHCHLVLKNWTVRNDVALHYTLFRSTY